MVNGRRRGELDEALTFYKSALALARHDPDLEQAVDDISRALTPEPSPMADGLSFEQVSAEFMSALDGVPAEAEAPAEEPPQPLEFPALPELERFLDAIHNYRQRRAG